MLSPLPRTSQVSLVSIRLFVFVRREALPAVSHLQTGTRGTGPGTG